MSIRFLSLAVLPILALAACGGNSMTGPSAMNAAGSGSVGASFMSVAPQGGMTAVSLSTPLTFRFGGPMATGMEQYFDLHMGGLDGPVMPMTCAFSSDRTVFTCTPATPLLPRTTYTIHMGGGLMDGSGRPMNFDPNGPMMGGQWIQGGMMGSGHAGSPWSMMNPSWRNANGAYGMAFTFTTA